jgi:hypothetical protein
MDESLASTTEQAHPKAASRGTEVEHVRFPDDLPRSVLRERPVAQCHGQTLAAQQATSCTIARLADFPAGGGTAALLDAWWLGDLDGKPEGLALTAQGRAIVGLDTRKPRRNLVLLEPPIAQLRPGQSRPRPARGVPSGIQVGAKERPP